MYAHFITLQATSVSLSYSRGLQWWSLRKYILKYEQMTDTFDMTIKLHNYIPIKDIEMFPVHLRMPLIYPDFPTGSGSVP